MTDGDLTRWNRAGLRRFRYVQGNAATYLELVRAELAARFEDWGGPKVHVPAALEDPERDPLRFRNRLTEQYAEPRRDMAWEIARTFARAVHVLVAHVDAFANEGYLDTVSQWDFARKLVEMLDYHPAAPASASTAPRLNSRF